MSASPPHDTCLSTSEAILKQLPHRPPFLFLSHVLDVSSGDQARAIWEVTGEEPFLAGHFPSQPIVPGVLIGEALAQLAGLVVFDSPVPSGASSGTGCRHNAIALLASLDLRFIRPVTPPASISLRVTLTRSLERLHLFDVTAHHEEQCVCRGTLALAESDPTAQKPGRKVKNE